MFDEKSVAFILGVPRSGTTLLRVLLNSHPKIVSLPETPWISGGYGPETSLRHLVDYLCEDELGAGKNVTGFDKGYAMKGAQVFMRSMFESMLENTDAERLVFKTPDDMGQLAFLTRLCPDAKYVHIIRDGRDVACSSNEAIANPLFSEKYGEPSVVNFMRRWSDWENELKTNYLSALDVVSISYEDLVRDAGGALREVVNHLQVPFDKSMLDYTKQGHDYPEWEQGSQDVKKEKSIHTRSVGRWKSEIPYRQWSEIDREFGESLESAGYMTCMDSLKSDPECMLQQVVAFEDELLTKGHELKEVNAARQETEKSLSVEVSSLQSEVVNLQEALEKERADSQELRDEIVDYKKRIELSEEVLHRAEDKNRQLLKRIDSVEKNNKRMDKVVHQNVELVSENDKLKEKLTAAVMEISLMAKKITANRQYGEEVCKRLERKKAQNRSLGCDLNQARARLASLREQKQYLIDEYDRLSAAHCALQDAANEFRFQSRHWFRSRLSKIIPMLGMPKPEADFLQSSQVRPGALTVLTSPPVPQSPQIQEEPSTFVESKELPLKVAPTGEAFGEGLNLGDEQHMATYGKHRSGWSYAVSGLVPLQNNDAIYFDTFVERTLRWHPDGPHSLLFPWIGIVHEPHNVPDWLAEIPGVGGAKWSFEQPVWKKSLEHCRGLFAMSEYSAEFLRETFPHLPVSTLVHPTEFPEDTWSWERFERNREKAIIQVGWYLRNLHAIYELPESPYRKLALPANKGEQFFDELFKRECEWRKQRGLFFEPMYETATMLGFLPNDEYDKLLSENVGFLNLYDSSANNAVIECIARSTPLLVNPLPSVVEYLGVDYPLYYCSYQEAIEKACDYDLIRTAHEYLKVAPIREKMTRQAFRESVLQSEVYKSIPKVK